MEEGFAMISLEEGEQGGISYEENAGELSEIDTRWCLVVDQIKRPYGSWMRAEPRRRNHTIGSKWLRMGGVSPANNTTADSDDKVVTEIDASSLSQGGKSGISADRNKQDTMLVSGEKHGDISDINKSLLSKNQEGNTHETLAIAEVENHDLLVIDPKRRRMDKETGPSEFTSTNVDTIMSPRESESQNQKKLVFGG
ncbi:hypothetical protein POM88_028474 [Heracleum sosnowskyi]|uniref:Uncharacterized protein n=1 Tax=Heracleum sosnowskyi TaxID=360622 RepID=A0AAD8HSY3_9APIA|nr:hypothetical protein POM88_028474 [Heracleum sosnowskyi]